MTRADALKGLLAAVEAGTWRLSQDAGTLFSDSAYSDAFAAFDGSKDAAIAFTEAVLPEWEWQVFSLNGKYVAVLDGPDFSTPEITSDNPARALGIAALRALISQEEANA